MAVPTKKKQNGGNSQKNGDGRKKNGDKIVSFPKKIGPIAKENPVKLGNEKRNGERENQLIKLDNNQEEQEYPIKLHKTRWMANRVSI